ncbi:energy transducer TonB [Flavobacterium arcticum]|uniref:Energy transducer TonB n=1 Tax=Flavobacterium arcticum TaxID=1784713 RepID=A0A345HCG0_9FLAO|nr:energy transducer TonB [Flavobacterium arcticum]AXG74270.1 energy transducer TonB [Flavobacterium arcticum]KAF2508139.1 energy transducer TonB [Flavobacterium arcticum]
MSKLNIFREKWIDMVFEGRNQEYGAYKLRAENSKTTVRAFIIGALLFITAISTPLVSKYIGAGLSKADKKDDVDKIIEMVDLLPPPEEEPLPPPPPPVEEVYQAPKSVVEEVKFKPLEAAKKEEVPEDPPKIEQFKEADPSSRNAEASPTGDINIGKPSGDLDKGVEVPDNAVYNTAGLQVQPEYPGGIEEFYNYVNKNFRIPDIDQDMKARIYVSFVVEKDGSMTGIKVLRDPGYGLGKEAERVLKSMKKKWSPGIQNGKPVRASYNLPITINIRS